MECSEAERLGIAVTQARMAKLSSYEGCQVKYCRGDYCIDGRLEEVDQEPATVTLRTGYGLVIVPFDPDGFELTVYKCPGDEADKP